MPKYRRSETAEIAMTVDLYTSEVLLQSLGTIRSYPHRTASLKRIRKSLNLASLGPVRPKRVMEIVTSDVHMRRLVGRRIHARPAKTRHHRSLSY